MLAALVLGSVVAQAPAPQATPLLEIIRVHSNSAFCSSVHERIAPSVAALIENDDSIAIGTRDLQAMGHDRGTAMMRMDMLHLENDIANIRRNLDVIYALLAQATSAAASAQGADNATLEDLKDRLRKIADSQRAQLNVLGGTLDAEQMAEMNADIPRDPSGGPDIESSKGGESLPAAPSPTETPSDTFSGGSLGKIELQVVDGMNSTHRVEGEFTASLAPIVARCK